MSVIDAIILTVETRAMAANTLHDYLATVAVTNAFNKEIRRSWAATTVLYLAVYSVSIKKGAVRPMVCLVSCPGVRAV